MQKALLRGVRSRGKKTSARLGQYQYELSLLIPLAEGWIRENL